MAVTTWTSSHYVNGTWEALVPRTVDVKVEYEGCVLRVYTRDVRVMSDVWDVERVAEVWNASEGKVEVVQVMGLGYAVHYFKAGEAEVDATPEVLAAVEAYRAAILKAECEANARYERSRVTLDKVVVVVKGKERGKVGRLFWMGNPTRYGSQVSTRVGLALDNVRDARGHYSNVCWTYLANLEVVGYESHAAYKAAGAAFDAGTNPLQAASAVSAP